MSTIKVAKLGDTIVTELQLYSKEITDGIKELTRESTRELLNETRRTAPVGKRKKHYKNHISYKTQSETYRSISCLWYVRAPDYRLSHLLNNGHQLRQGGRVAGTHFIDKAAERILPEHEKKCERFIQEHGT